MAEKEYIERKMALKAILGQPPGLHYPSWYADDIKKIPSADVVEVVRCKDCEYCWQPEGNPPLCSMWTDQWDMSTDLDGYCHKAKRRECNNE